MKIRYATKKDIENLSVLRKKQLIDEGLKESSNINSELFDFFNKNMENNSLVQIIIEEDEKIISTGAVIYYDFPPSFTNKFGKRAYIANMYTESEYRGRGLAKKVLKELFIDIKNKGIDDVFLVASEMGSPLYKSLGFVEDKNYLRKKIK